jgi:hypothetical protein
MGYRSLFTSLLAAVALVVTGLAGVTAQDSSPAAGDGSFAGLTGLPEFEITLTDGGLEGVPAETDAGWHLVTFTNAITPTGDVFEDAWAVEIVMLPEDLSFDDFAALLAAMTDEGDGPPDEVGSGAEASPASAPEDPFAWASEAYQPGGPGALQGGTGQGVVYLEPGDYAVLVFGPYAPAPLTVNDAGDTAGSDVGEAIQADVTITETGTSGTFDFSVETGSFAGGPAVVEIYNDSDQPHFVFGFRSDEPVAEDQVMALLMTEEGGTPPPGALDPSQLAPGLITGTQSPGTTQYLAVDLEPGYYVLLCFVSDPEQGGVPHVFAGMIEIAPIGV